MKTRIIMELARGCSPRPSAQRQMSIHEQKDNTTPMILMIMKSLAREGSEQFANIKRSQRTPQENAKSEQMLLNRSAETKAQRAKHRKDIVFLPGVFGFRPVPCKTSARTQT